jgi:NADPH:quinone reductase-like Zn-dependent oxidoreductase
MRTTLIFWLLLFSAALAAQPWQQVVITEHGGPEVLALVEVPILPEPGPGQVRLRVLTASASFTDIMVRDGNYGGIDAELPYPPGYDLVGVIDKLGDGVDGFKVGQRVGDLTVWGGYSEYALRPVANLVPLPEGIGDEEAVALILSYTTAYQMMHRVARLEAGQSILIHGASGAVGTALAQLGRVSGLRMFGTASAAKHDYVSAMGVTPIDYRAEDFVERVMTETGGEGVDVVFDAISLENFKRSWTVLKPGGELVIYGLYQASLAAAEEPMGMVMQFIGYQWNQFLWNWFDDQDRHAGFYSITDMRNEHPDWFRNDLASLFELLAEGNISPEIWKVMPLGDAAQAQRDIAAGRVSGKIVLRVSE